MAPESEERRKFTRVDFDTGITLTQGDKVYHTYLVDISLNGLLVKTPTDYALSSDSLINTSIILSEDAEIQMSVVLIHSSNQYLGFKCESIDMDSISHLRRLIELNMDSPRAAERILAELIELHHQ